MRQETHGMRQAFIRATAALAIAFAATFASAQSGDYKIGFVNTERLFREATPAKRARGGCQRRCGSRPLSWFCRCS